MLVNAGITRIAWAPGGTGPAWALNLPTHSCTVAAEEKAENRAILQIALGPVVADSEPPPLPLAQLLKAIFHCTLY